MAKESKASQRPNDDLRGVTSLPCRVQETVDVSLPAANVKPVLSSKNSKEEYALAKPDQYATLRDKPTV